MAKKKSAAGREAEKAVRSAVRRANKATLIAAVLFLAAGIGGGILTCRALGKNDAFELIGEKDIVLSVGDAYTELGCRAVSLGRDLSNKVTVEIRFRPADGEERAAERVDTSVPGEYIIVYRVSGSLGYGKDYKRVRTVVVTAGEENNG